MEVLNEVSNEVFPDPSERKRNVIVTGFGPFGGHEVNASWEAVRLLPKMGIEKELDINLIIEEMPVQYNIVETKIPELWKEHNPLLVIHVGVSRLARNLTLEHCANRNGYIQNDVSGLTPKCGSCEIGADEMIHCSFDVNNISEKINSMKEDVETSVSTDAGRYLCEYIYYTSLSQDKSRSIFIHVPDICKPYTSEQSAIGICKIIKLLVEELRLGLSK